MNNSPAIRLLATTDNERGDLFTRLTKDLFFALGYDNLRTDVHKAGREIDIQGEHRFEPRRVAGECKAHAGKMGGAELNKFFGALTRERKKAAPTPVAGYFVSLSGFTETGVEQEIETGDDRIILLDSQKVVDELERCRVIVERATAAERAGQCAQHAGLRAAEFDGTELLGHRRGYLWAIYYAHSKERTHVALIHADGTPLSEAVAQEVIEADRTCGGTLHTLRYLAPPALAPDRIVLANKATENYRQWLGEECGYIHLDGLPADTDLSATRLKLERLFVPLKAIFLPKPGDNPEVIESRANTVFSIGEVLDSTSHLALLAAPGGGKSTLLKRLATAYAFPERHGAVLDNLPQRNWLPLFLRCRELRDRAHRPIIELLNDVPRHAGMNAGECSIFQETIHSALRAGHALLLIDGLDEISDEGARQTFANHLRTFLAMFPQAALVVTSREAGFRLVAGVVASACEQAKVAPFDEKDVLNLCEHWHAEVIGDSDKVRSEARELGKAIWDNERIRKLSENPLLLTTLLVVKRWIGELPRSRAALYREAIRVLVRTWNVEGFAPLDEDETLAQLSYVACSMMEEGQQQITQKSLLKLLQSSRRELEAELQFARISPQEFIERIEYRSSLLMQTGYEHSVSGLEPVYEFRHLTFQEYLAARGYVEEQYPGRDSGQSLADVLDPHFEDERWQQVVPLAAVLAGRKAEALIKALTMSCERPTSEENQQKIDSNILPAILLYQCILDEVQITAPTLRSALLILARYRNPRGHYERSWGEAILSGKFGTVFQEIVEQEYISGNDGFEEYISAAAVVSLYLRFRDESGVMSDAVTTSLQKDLEAGDQLTRVRAALVCMRLAFESCLPSSPMAKIAHKRVVTPEQLACFQSLSKVLMRELNPDDMPYALASSWALAWIAGNRLLTSPPEPEMIVSLYDLWHHTKSKRQIYFITWALARQPLLPRDTFNNDVWGDCDLFLRQAIADLSDQWKSIGEAALVVAWYRRAPWNDAELVEQLSKFIIDLNYQITIRELLDSLGDAGQLKIKEWEHRQKYETMPIESEAKTD